MDWLCEYVGPARPEVVTSTTSRQRIRPISRPRRIARQTVGTGGGWGTRCARRLPAHGGLGLCTGGPAFEREPVGRSPTGQGGGWKGGVVDPPVDAG